MKLLILAFFLSLVFTLLLIRYQHLHQGVTSDSDLSGPQKFHSNAVPRIGGVSIFLALILSGWFGFSFLKLDQNILLLQISICALPTFLIGTLEDLTKKIGVKERLLASACSAAFGGYFLNIWITQIQVTHIDSLLAIGFVSVIFTIIAVTGLVNAYNIIDGFNGLASMVGIISLLAIGYVALKLGDFAITSSCLIVLGAISGFFIWNYPRGLIFLGDGGAYLIGYLIASLSILLVTRNPSVSPWFALLVNIYPIFETLFTIWRRRLYQRKNPSLPDGVHFHSLIYRRVMRQTGANEFKETASYSQNSKTSPYLWLLSSLAVFPAIIWWQTTWILQCFTMLFCVSYVWTYNSVVKFKTPGFFKLFK